MGPTPRAGARSPPKVRKAFESVDFIVDVDDSFGVPAERLRFAIDQEALEFHGVESRRSTTRSARSSADARSAIRSAASGLKPIAINVALPQSALTLDERLLSTPLPAGGTARQGANVELGDVVKLKRETASFPIFRHNGRFAEMVSGGARRPLRGADLRHARGRRRDRQRWTGARRHARRSRLTASRSTKSKPTLLWDGEWEVTYVTFRDMGAAFGVAILGIYLLVVAQFGSFKLPLVDPDAGAADPDRHRARPLAARRARSPRRR